MKRLIPAVVILSALALPAFAQGAMNTMTCSEYQALDSTGQSQAMADLQAVSSQTNSQQELTPGVLKAKIAKDCGENPSMPVMDVVKGDKTE